MLQAYANGRHPSLGINECLKPSRVLLHSVIGRPLLRPHVVIGDSESLFQVIVDKLLDDDSSDTSEPS